MTQMRPPEPEVILPPDVAAHGAYLNLGAEDSLAGHSCKVPGWWARKSNGVRLGTEWWCRRCDMVWIWENGGWYILEKYSDRMSLRERNK